MVRRMRQRVALAETALAQAAAAKAALTEPATSVLHSTSFSNLPHTCCFNACSLPSPPPIRGTIHQGCEGIKQRQLLTSSCDFRGFHPCPSPLGERRQRCERPTGGPQDVQQQ